MFVVAKSVKGHEFMYAPKSAHKVPKTSAKAICKVLNDNNFMLKENEVWFVHAVDKYDSASEFADWQKFTIRNGIVRRVTQYGGWM